jgi:hypothetical protein
MTGEVKKLKPKKALDSTEHRLRTVAIVMVLCLLLVIGIVAVFGTGRSRKDGTTAQTSQPAASAPAQSTPGIESVLVPPLSIYRRRNIFQPLVDEDNLAGLSAEAPSSTGAAGGAAGGGLPSIITLPAELDPSGQNAGRVISTALTLEGVFEQDGKMYGRIRVGDTLYEKVAVGEVFGDYYKLLALGKDSSASILYGDERFTVFAGQSLYW